MVARDGSKNRRFLVIDPVQLILVEPDSKRLGWGVATFVGFLQVILQLTSDLMLITELLLLLLAKVPSLAWGY